MARQNFVYIVVGNRGTGKTDFLKNTVSKLLPQFQKVLITETMDSDVWKNLATWSNPENDAIKIGRIAPEDIHRFKKGIALTYSSDTDYMFEEIDAELKNAVLVMEDSTKYIASKLPGNIRKLVLDSKQKNIDIFLVFHSLSAVPPELVRIANFVVLFKTNDGEISKTKYPFPDLHKAAEILNKSTNRFAHKIIQLY